MPTWSVLISGQVIPLDNSSAKGKTLLIGRDKKCHIFIDSNSVSRHHAEIRKEKIENSDTYKYHLRDLGSSNGTYIKKASMNNQGMFSTTWEELENGSLCKLASGDIVKFGDTDLTFTFKEELTQTGEVYLSELIREQNKLEEEEDEEYDLDYVREEKHDGRNQLVSKIIDLISHKNPFSKNKT